MELTPAEARVLGALVEKHMTTPDHYPLTTSALVAACNQSSNRNPVMELTEGAVIEAVDALRSMGLARTVKRSGERSLKHLEIADEGLDLNREQKALLAVLLLRGPQTSGELRLRTERYVQIGSLEETDGVLESMAHADIPVAVLLEREPGQKEPRWMHLLGDAEGWARPAPANGPLHAANEHPVPSRIDTLEAEVARLGERVAELELRLEESS